MNDNTHNSLLLLKKHLKDVQGQWIPSSRIHNTGIGKTLEDLIQKQEDNLSLPDLDGLEIKSQRANSKSLVTLFTKSPSFPRGSNTYLREQYGTEEDSYKIMHTTLYGHNINNYKEKFGFRVELDRSNERLNLNVYDNTGNILEKNNIHWSFSDLQKKFKKIDSVGYITAEHKTKNGIEHFKFEKITLLLEPTFENFLSNIENGLIAVDLRLGVYRSGKRKGKTHDHGTGFRIKKENFDKLFNTVIDV